MSGYLCNRYIAGVDRLTVMLAGRVALLVNELVYYFPVILSVLILP